MKHRLLNLTWIPALLLMVDSAWQPLAPAVTPGDVAQNSAHAHVEVQLQAALIAAHFSHPDGGDTEVAIDWFLYGWNRGWEEKDELQGHDNRVVGIGQVDLDMSLPVPEYEYYLLECRNKARQPGGNWETLVISESRFSRIAPYNGIWERTGEVTSDRAVLHTVLTEKRARRATGEAPDRVPSMAGSARFVVYSDPGLTKLVADSGFQPVDDYVFFESDGAWRRVNYNFRWTVTGLRPRTRYYYRVETRSSDGLRTRTASNVNSFRTAPRRTDERGVVFVSVTGLDVRNTCYDPPELGQRLGLKTFASMQNYSPRRPDFVIMTGDTVYYDAARYAPDVGYPGNSYLRRWHFWYAQYRYVNLLRFFQNIPGYWMVDDHDYSHNNVNDPWPDGWYIFRNANPTPGSYGTAGEDAEDYYDANPYGTSQGSGTRYWRALRWGRHLELFIEEGRNERDASANLIWGEEQKAWLEARIQESDATFKIVAATTPLLGPAHPPQPEFNEDKHAEPTFRDETESFLQAIKGVPNVFIVNGDRHWKYHSVINAENYPDLGHFNEFSSGAAAGGVHAAESGLNQDEWAMNLYADGAFGTGASAGYLRVEVTPYVDEVELRFELIAVTEELNNEVVHSQVFTAPLGASDAFASGFIRDWR